MRTIVTLIALGGLAVAGVALAATLTAAAASNDSPSATLTLDPATIQSAAGSIVQVVINVAVDGDTANAVEADIDYPSGLEFQNISVDDTTWGITAGATGGDGVASVAAGTTTPITGTHRVATITFKVTDAGDHLLTVASTSAVVSATSNSNLLPTSDNPPRGSTPTGATDTQHGTSTMATNSHAATTATVGTTTGETTTTPRRMLVTVKRTVVSCGSLCRRSRLKRLGVKLYWKAPPSAGTRLVFTWLSPSGHRYRTSRVVRGAPAFANFDVAHRLLEMNRLGVWRGTLVVGGTTVKTVRVRVAA